MKINKIVLYNFNSYEGLNEFDFTCENNSKNIILIGGKNGAGKTSLFTAIKIALYGPLSFGYVGVNPKYIAKIKDCINSRAFQKDVVRSKVQISVSLTVEREIKEYEITREWDYTKQKLDEKYYVKTEDRFLDGQELSYFQNYLQSMIPPDLFEFFLFDGEEVGSIFSTSTYNSYVKNAVYTLCGLDVFEIIRKYTTGYAGKASSKDEEKIYSHYKELRKNADEIDISFADLEAQIASDKNELEKVETELIEIETAFKNAGGITEVERQALMKEFTEAEHTKTESLTKIKMFVEGLMPFIILRDFTGRITEQLDFEEKDEIDHLGRRSRSEGFLHIFSKYKAANIDYFRSAYPQERWVDFVKKSRKVSKDKALKVLRELQAERAQLNESLQAIENWIAGGTINVGATTGNVVLISKAREDMCNYLYSAIDWQAEGVSMDNIDKIKKVKDRLIGFDRQKRGADQMFYKLPADRETQTVIEAFLEWNVLGKRSWNFDEADRCVYRVQLWTEKIKKPLIEAITTFENREIDYFKCAMMAEFYRIILFGSSKATTVEGLKSEHILDKMFINF